MSPAPRRRAKALFYAFVVVLVAAELVLVKTGVLSGPVAVGIFVAVELTLVATILAKTVRRHRATLGLQGALAQVLPAKVAGFVAVELRMASSIAYFVARRRVVPTGSVAYNYHREFTALGVIGVLLGVLELVATHFLIPWPIVRVAFIVVGAYGLLWLVALWAGAWVFPHTHSPGGFTIRYSFLKKIHVPGDAIDRIVEDNDLSSEAWFKTNARGEYCVPVGGGTNLRLDLNRPVEIVGGATVVRVTGNR